MIKSYDYREGENLLRTLIQLKMLVNDAFCDLKAFELLKPANEIVHIVLTYKFETDNAIPS